MEERKLRQLTMVLIDLQIKKMEIKMKHFEELEKLMEEEGQSVRGGILLTDNHMILTLDLGYDVHSNSSTLCC